jgi:hypothetical protein
MFETAAVFDVAMFEIAVATMSPSCVQRTYRLRYELNKLLVFGSVRRPANCAGSECANAITVPDLEPPGLSRHPDHIPARVNPRILFRKVEQDKP